MANKSRKAIRAAFAGAERSHIPTVRIRLETLESRDTPNAFVINTPDDTDDAALGDGFGLDANGKVSLRASIQEANFLESKFPGGEHTITYPLTGTDENPPEAKVIALQRTLEQIAANISIQGPGSDLLTVTRGKDGVIGIFSVAAKYKASMSGLTISGGLRLAGQGDGGAIENKGVLSVIACNIHECSAPEGGAIFNSGEIAVWGCTISNNVAVSGRGGGMVNTAAADIDQSTFLGNQAQGRGGGLAQFPASASTTLTDSNFVQNSAGFGGGIYNSGGVLDMLGGVMQGNTASAGNGGGLWGDGGTMALASVGFTGNTASLNGGAVATNMAAGDSCTLQDCNFSDNQCGTGKVGPNVAWTGAVAPTVPGCTGLNPGEPDKF